MRIASGSDAGIAAASASTGTIAGGATADVTIPWPTSFGSTDYTVVVGVVEGTTSADALRTLRVVAKTAADITVKVINDDGLNARSGTVYAVAKG